MMVMSINLGLAIMGVLVDDLASYALTLPDRPDRHSRPTAATLSTAIERLHLPPAINPSRSGRLRRQYSVVRELTLMRAQRISQGDICRRRHVGRPEHVRCSRIRNQRLCVRREKEALLDSPIRSSRYNADVAGMGTVPLLE
jgi:hypothetical protein